jgi:transcriptional regulator with XRE-family HTH domain
MAHPLATDAGKRQRNETTGARLAAARQNKGLSVDECARRCSVTPQYWHEFEADIRPLDFLSGLKAAELLEVEPNWLANRTGSQ